MNRRTFLGAASLSLLAAPLVAEAQQTKVSRIGLLGIGSAEQSPFFDAFRQDLRERGWVEGHDIVFEDRSRVDGYKSLPEVAADLVRLKTDVIVTTSTTGDDGREEDYVDHPHRRNDGN